MKKSASLSSGLLLFRRSVRGLELFLAHPGGPFWTRRDVAAWTIPKGLVDDGEDLLAAARREFHEETGIAAEGPFIPLGSVKQKSGKTVHAWGWEGDADARAIVSNSATTEWPRGSGIRITFPEVDRCGWFDVDTARTKLNVAQSEFVDRLILAIADPTDAADRAGPSAIREPGQAEPVRRYES